MPQGLVLEEGASRRHISMELGDGANSVSVNFQRGQRSGVKIQGISGSRKVLKSCYGILVKVFLYLKKIVDPQRPSGNWTFLILCMISITLDPLFFYIPVINDGKKCLGFDKKLGITASVLRLVIDTFHLMYIIFQLSLCWTNGEYNLYNNAWTIARKLLRFFLIEILAILPLPQVVILTSIPTIRGSKILNAMNLLKYFIFLQYLPRIIRIYPLVRKARRTSGILSETTWAKAASNLLLYMVCSYVFGALWYFFAIERETVCWQMACINNTECRHSSFYCGDTASLGNYTFLNDFCPTKTQNATAFDFGIFYDALQSGIVEVTDFPQKFLHCFRWGLQNLSCFGQNLQTSTYIWEDIFAILITIYGLVFFLILIGNMQIYLQSKTARSEEMRLKGREIEQWMGFGKLSEDLQGQVKKYQRYIWRETQGVDVQNLLNNLPKDLRRKIKSELCLELVKKVEDFEKLSEATLDALCDCVKPVFYIERSYIVREGDPIDEILFVVQGSLWTYTSKNRTIGYASNYYHKLKNDHLEGGDICGEELEIWARYVPSSSNLPISTRTIQALTKVEAFALMADDLKNVFVKYQLSNFHKLPIMTNNASFIQSTWRHRRRNRRKSTRTFDSGKQVVSSHDAAPSS